MTTKAELEAQVAELEAERDAEPEEEADQSAGACLHEAEAWLEKCFEAAKREDKHILLDENYARDALRRIRVGLQ